MRSLRRSLTRATVLSVIAVLIGAGVVLSMLVEASLFNHFDSALAEEARLLASMVESDGGKIDVEFAETGTSGQLLPGKIAYLQLWRENGEVLFRSASLREADLDRRSGPLDSPAFWNLGLPDGRPGRAIGIDFILRGNGDDDLKTGPAGGSEGQSVRITLVLARDTTELGETLSSLRLVLIALGLITIAVSAGALQWAVNRGLKPFTRLSEQINSLDERALSQQIDVHGAPKELLPIIGRLNSLLRRLDSAFERERQFNADVAHELRTPLAGLRTTIEVSLSGPREAGEYREALSDCLGVVIQMQGLVETLLSLARLESGQLEIKLEAHTLKELALANWAPSRQAAETKRLEISWDLQDVEPLLIDPSLAGLVMRNIFENAVEHCDAGGKVRIEVGENNLKAFFRVSNSGSGISAEMAEKVLMRFWRKDQARSTAGAHHGLGLALVDKIVSRLGGEVSVDTSCEGLFIISINFDRNRLDKGQSNHESAVP
jgi:two-component system heavy metal sensor histidine kinase CusS